MRKHRKITSTFFAAFAMFLIIACSGAKNDERGCLGTTCPGSGSDVLVQNGDLVITEGSGTSTGSGTGNETFSCSATPNINIVQHQEWVTVTIRVAGGLPPYQLDSRLLPYTTADFSSEIQVSGAYFNTGTTNLVVEKTVLVYDARTDSSGNRNYATCKYQVTVLPQNGNGGNGSDLSCTITPSNFQPSSGEVVTFTFDGTGGSGQYSFSDFSPMIGYSVPVQKESSTQSSARFRYSNTAVRYPRVTVDDGTNKAVCRTAVFVNGGHNGGLPPGFDPNWDWRVMPPWWYTFPQPIPIPFPNPPTPIPSLCSVTTNSNPGITGTLTKVTVTPTNIPPIPYYVEYYAQRNVPFNGQPTNNWVNSLLDSSTNRLQVPENANGLERIIRFRRPGEHRVTAVIKSTATNQTITYCQTVHLSRKANGFVTGPDKHTDPLVKRYRRETADFIDSFLANGGNDDRGVHVAVGDVTGDGISDVLTAEARGTDYRLQVRDGANISRIVFDFNPLPNHGSGDGAWIASGDVNADGHADILVGQGDGRWVKVYDGSSASGTTPTLMKGFTPYGSSYSKGVRIAAGDVNGDGYSDIIVAPGPDGRQPVKIYSGRQLDSLTVLHSFHPFMENQPNGQLVASGDVNGDGYADVIVSLDKRTEVSWYTTVVKTFSFTSGSAVKITEVDPYTDLDSGNYVGGTRLAVADVNGDGYMDLITAPGRDVPPKVRLFRFNPDLDTFTQVNSFNAYAPDYEKGVFVGGGTGGL